MANTSQTTKQLRRSEVRSPFRRSTQLKLRLKKPVITESDIPVIVNFKIPPPVARGKLLPNTSVLQPKLILKNKKLRKQLRRKDI